MASRDAEREAGYRRAVEGMARLPLREVYEVGGSVRDDLLGRVPKDVDFLVRGHDVADLLGLLGREGHAEELTVAGRLVGVRFWPRWGPRDGLEVVPPRRETPILPGEPHYTGNPHRDLRIEPDPELPVEQDLERRDFTANAIARDVRTGAVIDPFGGADDLRDGVLRVVHPTAFRDDPLRILRGVARRSRDGLVPDPETRRLMAEWSPRIAELSSERIRETLDDILEGDDAGDALRLARDVGALGVAVPELAHTFGAEQRSQRHALSLDEHLLSAVDAAAAQGAPLAVRLAALWHDVGKPLAETGAHARKHAEIGATIAGDALRRLTYDGDTVRLVEDLVRQHAYPEDREPSPESARRFLRRVGREAAPLLLQLRRADRGSTGRPVPPEDDARRDRFERLVREAWDRPVTRGELAVDGDDLLALGYQSGPGLGAALEDLLDAVVADPRLNEREPLLDRARARLREQGS